MNIFKFIVQIFPLVVQVVGAVEKESGAPPGSGLAKSKLALDMIHTGLQVADAITDQKWEKVQPGIQQSIDNYVKFANAVGIFQKSPQIIAITTATAALPE